jgi:hypothetical protein
MAKTYKAGGMEKPTRDRQIESILSTLGMVALALGVWAWSEVSTGLPMHQPVTWQQVLQQVLWWMLYAAGGLMVLWVLLLVAGIGYFYFFKPEEFWTWDKTTQQWKNRHDRKELKRTRPG